ncbi:GFA family protein [Pendulispora brunnea]|uniref:GFA family protein n=1 Tax=Pendulispora brunnea TaxID=2905690 RepID=A0ABZ2KJY0_9BACT
MKLEGSCQCGKVTYRIDSDTPYPYMYCFCSICRKTSGALTCNIMGKRDTLKIRGERYVKKYHAVMREKGQRPHRSEGERWFCGECGTHLFVADDRWPEGIWPNAAAVDTELPEPPEQVRIMLAFKPKWVPAPGEGPTFKRYPKLSIAKWHENHGLSGESRKSPKSPKSRKTRKAS